MNNVTDNKGKEQVLKTLAIGGFVGLIIIIAWLGIQLISFMPSAFTSLASLADSVYNYKPVELIVVSNKSVANAGEAFSISWNKPKQEGFFSFKYQCVDGVAVEVRSTSDKIENVTCENDFVIGSVDTLDINITSEKNRFTEVPYSISFTPIKSKTASATKASSITVVNAMISPTVTETATTTPVATVEPTPVTTVEPTPVVDKPIAPVVVTKPTSPVVAKPKPIVKPKPVYSIPVSNPAGTIDIAVRSIGVGTIDSNNNFSLVGVMDNDSKGAIQFEIKNIGTKTSNTFTFVATLPSGAVYTSPVQTALKPNERAVITLGFEASDLTGIKTFNVSIDTTSDINLGNNRFTSAVRVND